MRAPFYICLALIGMLVVVGVVGVVWRFASRRRAIPCPVWLRWLVELDNPFTATNRAAVIIEHLDLRPGMTVLDIGSGSCGSRVVGYGFRRDPRS